MMSDDDTADTSSDAPADPPVDPLAGDTGAAIDVESTAPSADSASARLEVLQRHDSEIDERVNRRERVPEREALAAATHAMTAWERERTALRARMDELTATIERSEEEAAESTAHRTRLEAQMKTVIAPREAEALLHEMATLDERRDAAENVEIEALEEQSTLDDRLTAHLSTEQAHRDAMESADDALGRVVSEIDAEIASITTGRNEARRALPEPLLARYDRVRASSGVAVAHLAGHRCTGCHLDLSAAEIDDVKDEAAAHGGVADCPQCGRMLVV